MLSFYKKYYKQLIVTESHNLEKFDMSNDNCNRTCKECNKEFTPRKDGWDCDNWETTCKNCRGSMKVECKYCSKEFIQKKDDYYFYNNIVKYRCDDCKVTHEELMNGTIDNNKIYDGKCIKIIYKVLTEAHLGDYDNEETNYYPLMKNIKNKHYDNGITTDNKILVLYERDTEFWNDSDGYQSSIVYEIIEAEIVDSNSDSE
uniref:Uncharacterized protein n=1 Tax=Mimivirus LCMiAC02 TaxID=2506609 RepID=A0A4P6VMM0_9VIRU|nr:MAG: hypothetical protein LCMiAC02_05250 [Mimivirus LCMiAC02]